MHGGNFHHLSLYLYLPYMYIRIFPPSCQSVCLSKYVQLSVCLFNNLSASISGSQDLSNCLSVCISGSYYMSNCRSVCLSASQNIIIYPTICLSVSKDIIICPIVRYSVCQDLSNCPSTSQDQFTCLIESISKSHNLHKCMSYYCISQNLFVFGFVQIISVSKDLSFPVCLYPVIFPYRDLSNCEDIPICLLVHVRL